MSGRTHEIVPFDGRALARDGSSSGASPPPKSAKPTTAQTRLDRKG
jgi:hypothetical protein